MPDFSKKMRIGILRLPKVQSGTDQLSVTITESLIADQRHEFVVFNQDGASDIYDRRNVTTVQIDSRLPPGIKLVRTLLASLGFSFPFGMSRKIREQNLDLLVTTSTASLAGLYAGVPYICYIADLMHRFYPELPDFGFWEKRRRDSWYGRSARNSVRCIVDSDCGRVHVSESYGVDPSQIVPIASVAPPYIYGLRDMSLEEVEKALSRFNLPNRFLIFPAQFWAHKNHLRLLAALKIVKDDSGIEVPLVLTGAEKNSRSEVSEFIRVHGLDSQVRILGYVSDRELAALYRSCRALVFPSLFGPTNIPIVEAIIMGKPVLCSRLFAMPEQVGDAGILFDPFAPEDIARAILSIWSDDQLCAELEAKASRRAAAFTLEAYARSWATAIEDALGSVAARGRSGE